MTSQKAPQTSPSLRQAVGELYARELNTLAYTVEVSSGLIQLREQPLDDGADIQKTAAAIEAGARQAIAAAVRALQIAEGMRAMAILEESR